MTNLVIGSDGFIGKPFSLYLEDLGEKVIRFDIKRGEKEDARFSKLNLEGVDRVFFLAWDVGGAKYLYDDSTQLAQLNWNLKLLSNVMPQLAGKGIPFLFISSQLAEEVDTVYGVTKRLGEIWTSLIGGTFVRQWNVYGHIEKSSRRSHVISDLVRQAIENKEIKLLTTGEEKRQFVHVDDTCRAWHRAIELGLNGKFDVTSFEWVKIVDVAEIIGRVAGARVIRGDKIGSTPITPIREKIPGWLPLIKLENGLTKMVEDAKKELLHDAVR